MGPNPRLSSHSLYFCFLFPFFDTEPPAGGRVLVSPELYDNALGFQRAGKGKLMRLYLKQLYKLYQYIIVPILMILKLVILKRAMYLRKGYFFKLRKMRSN